MSLLYVGVTEGGNDCFQGHARGDVFLELMQEVLLAVVDEGLIWGDWLEVDLVDNGWGLGEDGLELG